MQGAVGGFGMNERAKELGAQLWRYLGEAWAEWSESIKDSPEAHLYSLILGALTVKVIGWIL